MSGLAFSPVLPAEWLAVLAIIAAVILLYMVVRSPLGGLFRLLVAGLLLTLLARPQLITEETTALPDIALIIEDVSASQQLDERDRITADAVAGLEERLGALPDMETRVTRVEGREETRLGEAIAAGLADIPRGQLSGVFVVSDGQSADRVPTPESLGDVRTKVAMSAQSSGSCS